MNITAIVLDLILIGAVCYYFSRGWRRGFVSTFIYAIGYLVACVGGYIGSRALAETSYQLFIRDRLIGSIRDALTQSAPAADLSASIEAILETVPQMVREFVLSFFGGMDALIGEFGGMLTGAPETVSVSVADQILYPVIYALLQAIFFLLLFFAIMVLVRSLSKVFRGVRHLPLIGSVNALLGGALGLVQGMVVIFIVTMALRLLVGLTGDSLPLLNSDVVESTYLFRLLYDWNPIGGISSGFEGFSLPGQGAHLLQGTGLRMS